MIQIAVQTRVLLPICYGFPLAEVKPRVYLGLTAYTLAIRRLQGNSRRTLGRGRRGGDYALHPARLLTLQQFQRAAALICACEVIRQNNPQRTWGATPFRLGLWVGQRTTPNTTEQSEESSKQDRGVFQRGSTIGGAWLATPVDQLSLVRFAHRSWHRHQDRAVSQRSWPHIHRLRGPVGTLPFQPSYAP